MSILKKFARWFLYITTAILIVTSILFELYGVEALPKNTLWQILVAGFLTTLVTVLFSVEEITGKKRLIVGVFLHYVALCVVMIVCGNWFGWLSLNLPGILMMVICVAIVYSIVYVSYYLIDRKQAEKINQKLKEKYGDEE